MYSGIIVSLLQFHARLKLQLQEGKKEFCGFLIANLLNHQLAIFLNPSMRCRATSCSATSLPITLELLPLFPSYYVGEAIKRSDTELLFTFLSKKICK